MEFKESSSLINQSIRNSIEKQNCFVSASRTVKPNIRTLFQLSNSCFNPVVQNWPGWVLKTKTKK